MSMTKPPRILELTSTPQLDKVLGSVIHIVKRPNALSKTLTEAFKKPLKIPGFNDPVKAPPPMLKRVILETAQQFLEYETLIVEVWSETKLDVRDVVRKHFDELPDSFLKELGEDAYYSLADAQAEKIASQNGEFDKEDVLLMSRHTAGAMAFKLAGKGPQFSEDEIEDPELLTFLRSLRTRPPENPVWSGDDIPALRYLLEDLRGAKSEWHDSVADLKTAFAGVANNYAAELGFFSRNIGNWGVWMPAQEDFGKTSALLASLGQTMEEYIPIRDRASDMREERRRRDERQRLEDRIDSFVNDINALLSPPPPPAADQAEDGAVAPAILDPAEASADVQRLTAENEAMHSQNEDLQAEADALKADIESLTEENSDLASNLRISENYVLYWRNLYESGAPSVRDPVPLQFDDVSHAIETAKKRFGDKIIFAFNSASDTKFRYSDPKDIWDGLEWLATKYHRSRSGVESIPDFDQSIREFCGLWYKGGQSQTTRTMYRNSYTTQVDGVEYTLYEHIGKGTSSNEQHIFRIAFDWDRDKQRVIVGYIGKHQASRKF